MPGSIKRSYGLKTLLIAGMAALALPLVILVVVMTERYVSTAERALAERATTLAGDMRRKVDLELSSLARALRALSTSPAIDAGDYATFDRQARDVGLEPGIDVVLHDRNGIAVVNTRFPGLPVRPPVRLTFPDEVMAAAEPRISDLHIGPATGRRVTTMTWPVRRGGEAIGVLVLVLPHQHFVSILAAKEITPPFYGSLVDSRGTIIARTTDSDRFVGTVMPQFAAAVGNEGRVEAVNPLGIAVLGFYQRSTVSPWTVTLGVEKAALAEPLRSSLWLIGFGFVLIASVSALVVFLIARRVVGANKALVASAEALGRGETVSLFTTGVSEADQVGASISAASTRLQDQSRALMASNETLKKAIAQRISELAAKTMMLEATLESMDQGLIMADADTRITLFNRRGAEMLGLPESFLEERPTSWEIIERQRAMGDFEGLPDPIRLQLMPPFGERRVDVYERTRPNGLTMEVRTAPMPGGGIVRTYTDATVRKQTEAALNNAMRAADQARREADLANVAKTRFLASMSHEIRTPLNAVVGYAEILLDRDRIDAETHGMLSCIKTAAAALSDIVGDVLDFATIEAGRIETSSSPFDLGEPLAECLSILTPTASARGLDLMIEVDPGVGTYVRGDPSHLRQVLINLIGNGLKFTVNGGVSVTASRPDASERVRFEVRDTGPGVAPDLAHLLFTPFERLDADALGLPGGAGLGLAISRQLVIAMGGSIGHRATDPGSIFWFELPLARAEAPISRPVMAARLTEISGAVLVVDDVPANLDIARIMLEGAGFAVDTAGDGRTALGMIASRPYRVVLLDIRMPDLDGLAVAAMVRNLDGSSRDVPLLAVTASAFAEQVMEFRARGFDGHVAKPYRKAGLTEAVNAAISAGFNRSIFDEAAGVAPGNTVHRLLGGLEQGVDAVLNATGNDDLAERAHALVGRAGLLGFRRLADLAGDIENACRRGGDVRPLIAEFAQVALASRATIAALRSQFIVAQVRVA